MITSKKPIYAENINKAIKVANFTIFTIWTAGLSVQLIFLIKNWRKNSALDYVAAAGTGVTFMCYFLIMILEWQRDKILEQENDRQDKRLVGLENAIKELSPAKSRAEAEENKTPSHGLVDAGTAPLLTGSSPSTSPNL